MAEHSAADGDLCPAAPECAESPSSSSSSSSSSPGAGGHTVNAAIDVAASARCEEMKRQAPARGDRDDPEQWLLPDARPEQRDRLAALASVSLFAGTGNPELPPNVLVGALTALRRKAAWYWLPGYTRVNLDDKSGAVKPGLLLVHHTQRVVVDVERASCGWVTIAHASRKHTMTWWGSGGSSNATGDNEQSPSRFLAAGCAGPLSGNADASGASKQLQPLTFGTCVPSEFENARLEWDDEENFRLALFRGLGKDTSRPTPSDGNMLSFGPDAVSRASMVASADGLLSGVRSEEDDDAGE